MRHLVYTGNFYPSKRDPESLFAAFADLLAEDPQKHRQLRIDLYGPDEDWVRAKIAAHGLQSVVQVHGMVPYRESLAAQCAADALLFVDWMDAQAEGVLTGKLFEYLASARPILCVGNRAETEATRVILDCGAGVVATDKPAIHDALNRIASGAFRTEIDVAKTARYSRRTLARDLLARIEALLAAAR